MKFRMTRKLAIGLGIAAGIAAPTVALSLPGYSVKDMNGRDCVGAPEIEKNDRHVFYNFTNNCDRDLRLRWDYQNGNDSNGVVKAFDDRKVTAGIENPLVRYSVEIP